MAETDELEDGGPSIAMRSPDPNSRGGDRVVKLITMPDTRIRRPCELLDDPTKFSRLHGHNLGLYEI